MKPILTFIRHNPGIVTGFTLCALCLFWIYSCHSTVISLVHANLKVTRVELVSEVDTFLASAEARFEDLDRQDLIKETIFNSVLELAQGGSVNPIGVVLALAGILGIGAGVDNIKKRTHINTLKGESFNGKVQKTIKEILDPPKK